ncbi:hypothetical protein A6A04_02605 [Paramagnetospirillum marisnigri]|uniref:Gamma-butyrobetaine hydroxylase-like N-terminal domain-containing protein n=1 Tax=Paramagnetospirillum marisnigri TaxID=1285242 RepID=A0A178MQC1_9PROT|nr:DUF971 domain-containing protein [Paramagnetospirillum marisnigri]OAN50308.1 hypothetical protein A6A04_02605 [Paramagnetospirillum marisnigri]
MSAIEKPWPEEIKVDKVARTLSVLFSDGKRFVLPAELLRVESPSAEVQGHSPSEKKLVSGRMHVGIIGVEPVGNYAVKLVFDDLHDSGIYSWDYLYALGEQQDAIWANYLAELDSAGLSRDPALSPAPAPKPGGCGSGKAAGSCGCS